MRRLLTPRWILIHIAIGGLTIGMVFLGLWQLDRLDHKRQRNDAVRLNTQLEIETATQQMGQSSDEWRRVQLTGRYLPSTNISIINRSQDGVAGDNSALVFETETNGLFLVNRGFTPLTVTTPTAPAAPLSIVGYLRLSQSRGTLGAIDSAEPGTTEFQRFDLERISAALQAQINTTYYVQLIKESPSPNTPWPQPVALPLLDEGPHFSYAMQWFFFSAVGAAGWTVVVIRRLREPTSDSALEQTSV